MIMNINKPRIIKDTDSGCWWAILDDDVIVAHKDINYVSGFLDSYQRDRCARQDRMVELALEWKRSSFGERQEMALVKYLQEEVT
jgi:hypothetical protein